ncbi:hypothetical protein BD626DRAFT_519483 [Schizophyllum amplum]|uniref:Uncharacterized protein n=1 Tax=Schizophyllum amplum TaxID=97359 RepID=A0A550BV60_9AGAR|nr:hypothetical protein BD626DRAFT_519483 [Auriculariopsis ampla]
MIFERPTLLDRSSDRIVDPHRFRIGTLAKQAGTLVQRGDDGKTGMIVGAVVVGIALFVVIAGFFLAWRQRTSKRKADYMAADTGDAFDDGEHYDMDVQRAADDGVDGLRMYGKQGRGYGDGGMGYDDPYDGGYDTRELHKHDASPRYDDSPAKYDPHGRPVSTAESGRTLYDDGASLRKVQSDETIHVPHQPVDKEDALR